MSVRFEIALLTTVTSVYPAPWTFLRSTEAPMAEEPMPASQANTIERIGPCVARRGAGEGGGDQDFLPFIDSIAAVAADRSPSSSARSSLSRNAATRNETRGGGDDRER